MAHQIYVLSNEGFPHLLKIGKTTVAMNRDKALYTTGVPFPFKVEYLCEVADCHLAEKLVHNALANVRPNPDREFFQCSVEHAISTIKNTVGGDVVQLKEKAKKFRDFKGCYLPKMLNELNRETECVIHNGKRYSHKAIFESDNATFADILLNCHDENLDVFRLLGALERTSRGVSEDMKDCLFGSYDYERYKTWDKDCIGRFHRLFCDHTSVECIKKLVRRRFIGGLYSSMKDFKKYFTSVYDIFDSWGAIDKEEKLNIFCSVDTYNLYVMPSVGPLSKNLLGYHANVKEVEWKTEVPVKTTVRNTISHIFDCVEGKGSIENFHFIYPYPELDHLNEDSKGIVIYPNQDMLDELTHPMWLAKHVMEYNNQYI